MDSVASPNADQAAQPAVRTRIRFAKQGDLRFASHRDLLRVMERLFRRADVAVRQSEGFHPKPRFMFPSALGLGITGSDEVFDVDLDRSWPPRELGGTAGGPGARRDWCCCRPKWCRRVRARPKPAG